MEGAVPLLNSVKISDDTLDLLPTNWTSCMLLLLSEQKCTSLADTTMNTTQKDAHLTHTDKTDKDFTFGHVQILLFEDFQDR